MKRQPKYRYPVFITGDVSTANHPQAMFDAFTRRWKVGEITTNEMIKIFKYYGILWMWNDQIPY